MKEESVGMVYVFTGEGKGKTSAALGVTIRSLLSGWRVCWISFYKGKDWDLSEKGLESKFDNLEMHFVGEGFRIKNYEEERDGVKIASVGKSGKVLDRAKEEDHKRAALDGLKLSLEKVSSGSYGLVVLDEVNNAINDGLLDSKEVIEVLENRGSTHVVLTGRDVHKMIVEASDLVTDCRKVKHPYDRGKLAVKGLDF